MNMDCNEELHERMWWKGWAEIQTKDISITLVRQVEAGLVMLSTNLKNGRVYMQYTPKGERFREVFRLGGN